MGAAEPVPPERLLVKGSSGSIIALKISIGETSGAAALSGCGVTAGTVIAERMPVASATYLPKAALSACMGRAGIFGHGVTTMVGAFGILWRSGAGM